MPPFGELSLVCHQIIVCRPDLFISFPASKGSPFPQCTAHQSSCTTWPGPPAGSTSLSTVLLEHSLRCPHVLIDAMMSRACVSFVTLCPVAPRSPWSPAAVRLYKERACPFPHWCHPITWPQSSTACSQGPISPSFCTRPCCLHKLCSSLWGWARGVVSIAQLHLLHHSPRIKMERASFTAILSFSSQKTSNIESKASAPPYPHSIPAMQF